MLQNLIAFYFQISKLFRFSRSILRSVEPTMPRRFRSRGNGALWSIRFQRTGAAGISGCWSTRSAKVMIGGADFAAQ